MQTDMRRRRKILCLQLTGALFVLLLLLRTDWIDMIFYRNSRKHERGYHHQKHSHAGQKVLRGDSIIRKLAAGNDQITSITCGIPYMQHMLTVEHQVPASCVRIPPDRDSCMAAQSRFHADLPYNPCEDQGLREYCTIQAVQGTRSPSVHCSGQCEGEWELGTIDSSSGETVWSAHKTNNNLELAIQHLLQEKHEGFCLVQCASAENLQCKGDLTWDGDRLSLQQMFHADYCTPPQVLNLPPSFEKLTYSRFQSSVLNISFNIILIDSVSRHHFYRSLPKTVKVLDEMNSHVKENRPMVLDYELIQGVKSRTFENLQALFSGHIDPYTKPFGTQEMPKVKLKLKDMFGKLDKKYQTLWLEDLCPYWEWGIPKDLLVYNKKLSRKTLWQKLQSELSDAGIKSLGNTYASCLFLNSNGVPDPFHGPDDICYNGKQQHEYHLSYLKTYQQTMQSRSLPFFTFFETNQGHEDTGVRIQYLDSSLAEYLKSLDNLSNTITIMFSDHGNAYGPYVSETQAGRLETYHPFMFMIIPSQLVRSGVVSSQQLDALIANQKRLISILDVHYTLTYFMNKTFSESQNYNSVSEFNEQFNVTSLGLLQPVSEHRTCSLIPRIMPNLCICEGYDVTSDSQDFHLMLSMYFVGMLNNEIQNLAFKFGDKSRAKGSNSTQNVPIGGFRSCLKLRVDTMKNIQENILEDQSRLVKMDLYVTSEGQTSSEIFFMTLHLDYQHSSVSTRAFERITPYSVYSRCADPGVDLQLCVCDINHNNRSKNKSLLRNVNYMQYDLESDRINSRDNIKGRNSSQRKDHKSDGQSAETDELDYELYDDSPRMVSPSIFDETINEFVHPDLEFDSVAVSDDGYDCLYIIHQYNAAGATFTAVNFCYKVVKLQVSFKLVNVLCSHSNHIDVKLFNSDDIHLMTCVVHNMDKEWICDIDKYGIR